MGPPRWSVAQKNSWLGRFGPMAHSPLINRGLVLAGLLVLVGALGGCGGGGVVVGSSGESGPCLITSSGNKLCGSDARVYCDSFASESVDPGTVSACSSVGASASEPLAEAPGDIAERDVVTPLPKTGLSYPERVRRARAIRKAVAKAVPKGHRAMVSVNRSSKINIRTDYRISDSSDAPSAICRAASKAAPASPIAIRSRDGLSIFTCGAKP